MLIGSTSATGKRGLENCSVLEVWEFGLLWMRYLLESTTWGLLMALFTFKIFVPVNMNVVSVFELLFNSIKSLLSSLICFITMIMIIMLQY